VPIRIWYKNLLWSFLKYSELYINLRPPENKNAYITQFQNQGNFLEKKNFSACISAANVKTMRKSIFDRNK